MTHYQLIAVGHAPGTDLILQASRLYLDRLQRYRTCELTLVKPSTMAEEGKRIAALCDRHPGAAIVVLDEHGKALSTLQLKQAVERFEQRAGKDIAFVVGGAYGLTPELKARASLLWALSPLTLPHRLALLVVCEQIYRVHSMLRGEPYHHE